MCGIVGYVGPESAVKIVINGLSKLEYRGYDSAGISYIDKNNKIATKKEKGRLLNLEKTLDFSEVHSAAIGHTRWATHGKVSRENSHPHPGQGFSLVHNGIIENASVLKESLKKSGVEFSSETDSEVFTRLIEVGKNNGLSLKEAIVDAFKKIEGNSAFVIIEEETNTIYGMRKNAPLVCGVDSTKTSKFISSDPYAASGNSELSLETLYFPENDVLCELKKSEFDIHFMDLNLESTNLYKMEQNFTVGEESGKGEFEHYMLKEIHEQPKLIRESIIHYFENNPNSEVIKNLKPSQVSLTACGTAYYACLVIRDYLEEFARIQSRCEVASELRYRSSFFKESELGVFVSQSGETADTLATQQMFKENGVRSLSILNAQNTSLQRESDHTLLIHAGQEIGVASTKAFTMQCLIGRYFVELLSGKKLNKDLEEKVVLLSQRVEEVINRSEEIKAIAHALYLKTAYFFTGRGELFPVALEGALKLKEIAYVHAEGYASGELKHGPIAIIDENVVNIAYVGRNLIDKTVSNIQEIKARKGIIFSIGNVNSKELEEISDYRFMINLNGLEELTPILLNVVGQLFSYYVAKHKGTDIDKPRNLAKSVTVE
jgi:glutamine---fructose-6-phosphate transaminase (isomerizing)